MNFEYVDNTSTRAEGCKPSVSTAQSIATRVAFYSSFKILNLNTAIRFAPHNVTPVTLESLQKQYSNSTGSSFPFLGYSLATYFWHLQRIKISVSKLLLQVQNHCRPHVRARQQVGTKADDATANRRPSSMVTRKTMPTDQTN
jgi:hypothetical protein